MAQCSEEVRIPVPESEPTAVYTISFQGITEEGNTSTWCYSVSVAGAPGLSHWVLGVFELCQEQLEDKLLKVTRNGVELEKVTGYELGTYDGVSGIKFEVGLEEEESPVLYCITLKGMYEKTPVDVAVKGGPTPAQRAEDAICGPSCISKKQCITDLIESIALQEAGLAHIINAEGEKIQKAILLPGISIDDLLAINESVTDLLTKIIKLEMVLEFKLGEISGSDSPVCPNNNG